MVVKRFKGAKAKADKIFSEIIRSIGECEHCYKTEWLQCAHIISRRFNSTRTDLRNAFSLCAGCHRYYTDHPREFSRFITQTWAQSTYDIIYAKSQLHGKFDWDERAAQLKEMKDRLDRGEITLDRLRENEE